MIIRIASQLAATIAIAAVITGCASRGVAERQPVVDPVAEQLDTYVFEDGAVRHDTTNPEVARLWQEYSTQRRTGNLSEAKVTLEEAISLEPRDPALWSSAAELELDQNSHLRAENYAAKSNFLATLGNRPLRYRNWLIIQRAREGRGDLLGAREAEIESSKLSP